MLDPKLLRTELDNVARNLARRGVVLDRAVYLELESGRKKVQIEVEEFRKERNERSKAIGKAKFAGDDIEPLRAEVGTLTEKLAESESRLHDIQKDLDALLSGLPNLLHESVPDGMDETFNVELRRWGSCLSSNLSRKIMQLSARTLGLSISRTRRSFQEAGLWSCMVS